LRAALIEIVQLPVLAQDTPLPLQPLKLYPEAAVAVRMTDAPLLKLALHVLPQEIPAGELVTEPEPLTLTASV